MSNTNTPILGLEAHCIECGIDISRSLQSHVLCHACYTPEKAWNSARRTVNFCNICGGPMFAGNTQMAHDHCNLTIVHNIVSFAQEATRKEAQPS